MRSEVSVSRAAHRAIISPGEQLITRGRGGGGRGHNVRDGVDGCSRQDCIVVVKCRPGTSGNYSHITSGSF